MKLRTQYFLAFSTLTLLAFITIAFSLWAFNNQQQTTNRLLNKDSRAFEYASLFEKDLAQADRAAKGFIIDSGNEVNQAGFLTTWEKKYSSIKKDLAALQASAGRNSPSSLQAATKEAATLIDANTDLFYVLIDKIPQQIIPSPEYDIFLQNNGHLESLALHITQVTGKELAKGRTQIAFNQQAIKQAMTIIAVLAILCGLLLPVILSSRLSKFILNLTAASNALSLGDLNTEISVNRKDELGDLARSIKRMQKSFKIIMSRSAEVVR